MNELVLNEYNKWLNSGCLSKDEILALQNLKNNEEELSDSFYQNLSFGTAGLRGVLGLGTNRMNFYTVRKATQGLANFLNKNYKDPKVAIAFDSRNFSKEFALESAKVLSSNGITAYLYRELKPTPVLSYTVRYLKCDAGIIITASHNPKEYNGYKVYGNDGCQMVDNLANQVSEEINKLDIFKDIKFNDSELIKYVDEEVYQSFLQSTLKKSLLSPKCPRNIKIAYTPLNGTGRYPVQDILKLCNFTNVFVVKEQEEPDGNFPTCSYPNPELKPALKLGVELLEKEDCDILIATDPDCDRVGFVSHDKTGTHYFSGNELGILLADYIINTLKSQNKLPKNPVLVKTIVSTDMIDEIGKKEGVEVRDVLTGFKYIGEVISNLEKVNRKDDFLLGFEESCGYLTNADVRDKDAVNASMLVAEMCAYWKNNGLSIYERLQSLYSSYGAFKSSTTSYEFPGEKGKEIISKIMETLRANTPNIKSSKIVKINDYLVGKTIENNTISEINLPKSNVIKFVFEDSTTMTVRPSGTEPKLKLYFCGKNNQLINSAREVMEELFEGAKK